MNDSVARKKRAARLLADLDPRLLDFLKKKANTFVKWDLIQFFHENPHTPDTAENISRYTGRDPIIVTNELSDLVQSGVLNSSQVGDLTIFTLSPDTELRELVSMFVNSSEDRQFRVKAIYHVMRAMK